MTQLSSAVFLQIQNSKKPEQIISLVLDDLNDRFETQGLNVHFGVEEIRIDKTEFLQQMDEFAQVLSFLLETMSAAQDMNLPYGYQDRFDYGGRKYSLLKEDGNRVLRIMV
jgi:hypothetical protein